ncbi:unnamed protein product [Danaus chrysippus]|uniref:(African queen) hypothetical protein n=1 Tax=Danaus chrysippus TaxID=151541 RepID=A0A8J2R418_9NEOP|nr:unnamed protein product [Danaus chrysippus]
MGAQPAFLFCGHHATLLRLRPERRGVRSVVGNGLTAGRPSSGSGSCVDHDTLYPLPAPLPHLDKTLEDTIK